MRAPSRAEHWRRLRRHWLRNLQNQNELTELPPPPFFLVLSRLVSFLNVEPFPNFSLRLSRRSSGGHGRGYTAPAGLIFSRELAGQHPFSTSIAVAPFSRVAECTGGEICPTHADGRSAISFWGKRTNDKMAPPFRSNAPSLASCQTGPAALPEDAVSVWVCFE